MEMSESKKKRGKPENLIVRKGEEAQELGRKGGSPPGSLVGRDVRLRMSYGKPWQSRFL